MGDMPGAEPGPPGPGPKLLFGGGPRKPPGPYEPGAIGPIPPTPRGGFIRGLIPIGGGPETFGTHFTNVVACFQKYADKQETKIRTSIDIRIIGYYYNIEINN